MKVIQKIVGKIVNVLIVLVIIAIIICAYSVFSIKVLKKGYVDFFGYSVFEVATGSMKDEINIGDAVLVKIKDEYNVGDIVTYQSGDDYITHRVVSKNNDFVVTKGDANNVNDNPIEKNLILGKVVKIMPRVGIWKKVILTPKVIILILLTLFVFSILFSYDGNAIKIVASKKAQKEIDDRIEDEVNKKVAVINRRKRRVKKVLDATQIIDLSEVNNRINQTNEAEEIKTAKSFDLDDDIDKPKELSKKKKSLEATQILDISEIKAKTKDADKKKKTLDATQILNINEINSKVKEANKKKKTLDATQIIDISKISRK